MVRVSVRARLICHSNRRLFCEGGGHLSSGGRVSEILSIPFGLEDINGTLKLKNLINNKITLF